METSAGSGNTITHNTIIDSLDGMAEGAAR